MLKRVFGGSPQKNNRTKWLWTVTIFVFVVFIIVLGFIFWKYVDLFYGALNVNQTEKVVNQKKTCQDCVRRFIDGVYVKPGEENLHPIAVIIENHVDARPQFGLSEANLVYEAEAEGGITRYLAVYSDGENLEKIGPVRSARPYFVDWARELSALFIHCGGSPEALVKISKENIFNLNEFYQGKYFWRNKRVSAPHNIYISSDNINEYLDLKKADEGKFLSWQYKDDAVLGGRPEIAEIKIDFQSPDFIVKWKYDRENNEYVRYMDGRMHIDASGGEIRAKNVIIEYIKAEVIDEELRLKMQHIGEGKALVCLDGKCEEGEWRKKTAASRTRFYKKPSLDKGGTSLPASAPSATQVGERAGRLWQAGGFIEEEFKFNAGTTWIEVVRPEYEVIF
jgi:hypothetical protein